MIGADEDKPAPPTDVSNMQAEVPDAPEYLMSGRVGELEGHVLMQVNNTTFIMTVEDAEMFRDSLEDAINDVE
jgi:hypothetical protein